MRFTGQAHTSIFVKNLELSKQFYINLLSFTLEWEGQNKDEVGISSIALVKNNDLILELVQSPVEYMSRIDDGPIDHIAITTDDVYEAFEFIKSHGYIIDTDVVLENPKLFEKGARWFFFRGPDGERIEIAQG